MSDRFDELRRLFAQMRSPYERFLREAEALRANRGLDHAVRSLELIRAPLRELERTVAPINWRNSFPTNANDLHSFNARGLDAARLTLDAIAALRPTLSEAFKTKSQAFETAALIPKNTVLDDAVRQASMAFRMNDLGRIFLQPIVFRALDVEDLAEHFSGEELRANIAALSDEDAVAAAEQIASITATASETVLDGDYAKLARQIETIKLRYFPAYLVLMFLITFVISPIAEVEVQKVWERFRSTPNATVSARAIASTSAIDSSALPAYRYVAVSKLTVRADPRRISHIRGYLYQAEAVRLLRVSGSWSLVEFSDDGTGVRGWVYSRYLRKFPVMRAIAPGN